MTYVEMVKDAFEKMCLNDYKYKFTDNEEDERASVYHYLRNNQKELGLENNMRIFLSYQMTKFGNFKPDILICSHVSDGPGKVDENTVKPEVMVELKNWPSEKKILSDLKKLIKYKKMITDFKFEVVFLAIVEFIEKNSKIEEYIDQLKKLYPEFNEIHVFMKSHHDGTYAGPWNREKNTDPWRIRFRK